MKQALFVMSGVSVGLLASLVAFGCGRTEVIPRALAQAASPDGAQAGGAAIMGIGGASNNINDLCWVLMKDKGHRRQGDYDRYSLCLYKANGQGVFDLTDAREISFDGKLIQLNHPSHNKELTPQALMKKFDEQQQQQQQQQAPPQQNNPPKPPRDN
jgi:hypothetical protein